MAKVVLDMAEKKDVQGIISMHDPDAWRKFELNVEKMKWLDNRSPEEQFRGGLYSVWFKCRLVKMEVTEKGPKGEDTYLVRVRNTWEVPPELKGLSGVTRGFIELKKGPRGWYINRISMRIA